MIAVGSHDHEITKQDIARIEEVATIGKVPANREILEVVPHAYKLDGQDNIKDPLGMTGTRLEIDAHVVSVLTPHLINLQKAAESAKVSPNSIIVAGVAASRAVLSEKQIENGVALIDMGGSTTNIEIYEEGDLQFTAVVPFGGINLTNDLAIGLKTDPEIAEKLKIDHASAVSKSDSAGISLEYNGEIYSFSKNDIDEIIEARLEEIFESINNELKRADRAGKLPCGVVLTGGTAMLKGIADYARESLGVAACVGVPSGYGGVADGIDSPQFATVVGLMLLDSENSDNTNHSSKSKNGGLLTVGIGTISKLIGRLRT
jgi:cell division protein FtsA